MQSPSPPLEKTTKRLLMDRSVVVPVALSACAASIGTILTHTRVESHKAERRFARAKEERVRRQEAKAKAKEGDKEAPRGTLLEDVGIPNVYLWEVRRGGGGGPIFHNSQGERQSSQG
jgi:hypothetical protein